MLICIVRIFGNVKYNMQEILFYICIDGMFFIRYFRGILMNRDTKFNSYCTGRIIGYQT